jgi:hypothetical protein
MDHIVLEVTLAATLQKILAGQRMSREEKAEKSTKAIQACLQGKRVFLLQPGAGEIGWGDLCNSVAVEEVHDCYIARCEQQAFGGRVERGAVFVVFDRQGMGKSSALRALLVMKHSRAPEQGYYFSGHNAPRSGDEWYEDC